MNNASEFDYYQDQLHIAINYSKNLEKKFDLVLKENARINQRLNTQLAGLSSLARKIRECEEKIFLLQNRI